MGATPVHYKQELSMGKLFRFFIPLGFSVFLVAFSHFIIQSTLARAHYPALAIATYAIALSLLPFFERPLASLRQVTSVLVKDRASYDSMRKVFIYVFLSLLSLIVVFAFTPIASTFFQYVMGVSDDRVAAVSGIFQILAMVLVFSGIRLFYHGIIISNLQTQWLTYAVAIRIVGMALVAFYFIHTDQVTSGKIGALIFLVGMMIECLVCTWKGNQLLKKLPTQLVSSPPMSKTQIFRFYRPLLISSFLIIWIGPSINLTLGKTVAIEIAIASFVISENLLQLINSFFHYTHQVILQFYQINQRMVVRFLLLIGFVPALIMGIMGYTPVGPWILTNVMGVNEALQVAVTQTLRVFMIVSLMFPLLDACNGLLILNKYTKYMVYSQGSNIVVTILTLVLGLMWTRDWTGVLGAIAMTSGFLVELGVVGYILWKNGVRLQFNHLG